MTTLKSFKSGDFTGLAEDYSNYRPDYCPSVLNGLLGLFEQDKNDLDFADIGAGTGIWTRMVYDAGVNTVTAIEPNQDMRRKGKQNNIDKEIIWLAGTAEETRLNENSMDWISMASSFHWADFEKATAEFYRVLKPNGRFTALWNPRLIELNPLLVEIEAYLDTLKPDIKRVSSGRSGITLTLTEQLSDSPYFEDIVYLEGRHVITMSPSRYIGAWRSVNDLRVQLGVEKFNIFLDFIEAKVMGLEKIEATYLTRAWSAKRKV